MIAGFIIMVSCSIAGAPEKNKTNLDEAYITKELCETAAVHTNLQLYDDKYHGVCKPVCAEIVENEL